MARDRTGYKRCKEDHFIHTFRSLLHKNYAIFWSSDLLASIGHFIREIALYWLVYEITGSALALGVLGLCEAVPRLILSPFLGVLVDRYDRLRLLILVRFATSIPIFTLAFLYFAGILEFWHILILEVAFSITRGINPSASQSLIRDLVPGGEILNAVALASIGVNFARVMGPSIGGVLILWIGAGGCFLVYAVSLVISGLGMLLIQVPRKRLRTAGGNFLREIKNGFRYIWHEPVILVSIGAAYVISVFVGTYQRFLPVFAKEVLNVGPEGLGILMAAPGLGAVLSLTFVATLGERWEKETLIRVTATATPVFLILFCLSGSFLLSVTLLSLVGAAQVAFRTISRVIIQMKVPYDLLGRVMSVFLMDHGMRSIGSIVIGTSATLFGISLGFALTSVISLILTSVMFFRLGWRQKRF